MELKGWDEFEIGTLLFPFEDNGKENTEKHADKREYRKDSSYTASVAHWRVEKPVYNNDHCINCFNCWLYCPDAAILARDDKLKGVDYVHCKGCGVCVDVCPTNPKSLLMFTDHIDEQEALTQWPAKEPKKKKEQEA